MTRYHAVLAATMLLFGGLALHGNAEASPFSEDTPDERRTEAQLMRDDTLRDLYRVQPGAESEVRKAAGYAVFSNIGVKILVAGGGSGTGIAVDNKTGKATYMNMAEVQAGLGFGVKKFRLVWVFEKKSDLDRFINSGWELGAQTTASARLSGQGAGIVSGAVSVTPGVWLYQLTDDGLALELTAKGTKYFKDSELN